MSISYPLDMPTTIGIEQIELRAVNAVAISSSPFTYKQQIVRSVETLQEHGKLCL